MPDDVNIPMSDLEALNASLKNIITEFAEAGSRADALQELIGHPHGDGDLRDEVGRFENEWDIKRKELRASLENVQKRVSEVAQAWTDFDHEAAANLDTTVTPSETGRAR